MTQGDLSKRLSVLGTPLDRAVISRIEDGSRPTPLVEFLALALALSVPPAQLLTRDTPEDPIRLAKNPHVNTPEGKQDAPAYTGEAIRAWFAGSRPLDAEGVNPALFLWGRATPTNALSVSLRALSKLADDATAPEDQLRIARAGISLLEGLLPWLEIESTTGQ